MFGCLEHLQNQRGQRVIGKQQDGGDGRQAQGHRNRHAHEHEQKQQYKQNNGCHVYWTRLLVSVSADWSVSWALYLRASAASSPSRAASWPRSRLISN